MIQFNCQDCGKLLQVAEELAGKTIICRHCEESQTVPVPKPEFKFPRIVPWQGWILIALVSLVLFFNCITLSVGLVRPSTPPTWEYKIVHPSDVEFDSAVDKLGADGWELVFARRATSKGDDGVAYEMIFKRQKR